MKIMESQGGSPSLNLPMMGKILQVNPEHKIIKSLSARIADESDAELIKSVIEQIHDNARLADGELTDFNELISRTEKIIEKSLV